MNSESNNCQRVINIDRLEKFQHITAQCPFAEVKADCRVSFGLLSELVFDAEKECFGSGIDFDDEVG